MPRQVNAAERRTEITEAAVRILARGGTGALTLRSLAEEMNGSITLVTHYFANRSDLFEAIVDDLVAGYEEELAELERNKDAYGRLRRFLEWLLPLNATELDRERGRIALNSMRGEKSIDHFFEAIDGRIRELLASHLQPFLKSDEIPAAVDFLRASLNGITLSAVEHPKLWTPRKQLAVLDTIMQALNLLPSIEKRTG